tara:strand:+ start:1597 stop:2136 length:540 start_codon:yes stop_codon:yes gene_type:complete
MVFMGDLFYRLEGTGLFEYVLPFLLVFSIVFAIIEKTNLFGERKGVNIIVALIMGLLFVTQTSLVHTLNLFLPKIALFIIVAVMVLILFGLFGASIEHGFRGILLLLGAIASLIAIYWGLSPSLGFQLPYWIEYNWDIILTVVIILIIIFVVTKGKKQEKGEGFKNLLNSVDDMFGKGK